MKIQVRQNVFETNSSSMHSLVITKEDKQLTLKEIQQEFKYLNHKYNLTIYDSDIEFGRTPFRVLRTFKDKLYYFIASIIKEKNDDNYDNLVTVIKKYVPKFNDFDLPIINKSFYKSKYPTKKSFLNKLYTLEKQFKYKLDWERKDDCYTIINYPYTGYAEDYEGLSEFLKINNITIEDFLINKKYTIIIDGDEYYYWDNFKEWFLIDKNKIEKEITF